MLDNVVGIKGEMEAMETSASREETQLGDPLIRTDLGAGYQACCCSALIICCGASGAPLVHASQL